MADKASRGLVIYGDGLARFVDPSHAHLHSLASLACCGFLSLPHSPLSENEDARVVREFAQLVDACDACTDTNGEGTTKVECQQKSIISDRFMGMRAAIFTDSPSLKSFAGKLGFSGPLKDMDAVELLKLLGFHEGKILETNQFDLVFLHIGTHNETNGQKEIEYVNALVGGIMQLAPNGTEVGSRLHLSLVLSYGVVPQDDNFNLSISITDHKTNSDLSLLFPRQSYSMKGSDLRKDVRLHCPMLMAQWQSGVTRKDGVEKFSFQDFKENCGNLAIPADRFLYEVAFKLWKAPKYGA